MPGAPPADVVASRQGWQQQKQYDAHLAIGKAESDKEQQVLDRGTVLDMLKHLNSDTYLKQNAMAYYRIGMLGTPSDPIGANWVQLWFGRNLAIFNNIARNTDKGDRVLVIYTSRVPIVDGCRKSFISFSRRR